MDARPFVTSRLLSAASLRHGFSLRTGGVSQGPFASLNLSSAVGDAAEAVEENLARLGRAAGLPAGAPLVTVAQVHADRVLQLRGHALTELLAATEAGPAVSGEQAGAPGPAADALVALEPGAAVAVRVADCVPLLLGDPKTRAVAAVHSGWRGTRLGIAARAVRGLHAAADVRAPELLAAIGPCIGRCCYEVSRELASLFRDRFGPAVADDPAGGAAPHLDLRACVELTLREAGLVPEHVEQVPGCTSCEPERFYSHRRDRGSTGRMLGFIAAG